MVPAAETRRSVLIETFDQQQPGHRIVVKAGLHHQPRTRYTDWEGVGVDNDAHQHDPHLSGKVRSAILARQSRETILDIAERESRSLLELNPEYGRIRLRAAFRRSRRDDAQRAADEPGRGGG